MTLLKSCTGCFWKRSRTYTITTEERKPNKKNEKSRSNGGMSAMAYVAKPKTHTKTRSEKYAGDDKIARFQLKDKNVPWNVKFPEYKPTEYTLPFILDTKPFWADPDVKETDAFQKIQFNTKDGKTNRTSYHGPYDINNGLPLNPVGRTGLCGRGQLGKWGPNHAADPIVTRWKRDSDGNVSKHSNNKPILEFVSIQRKDTKEWAIPGGMVDAGENVSLTLKREFGEEALNALEEDVKESTKKHIEELFKHGVEVYKGYVDDPRNTDNAWMETIAVNFHDDDGTTVGKIPLCAGDDAQAVRWHTIDGSVSDLYASHADFIRKTCERLGAYFADS